MTKPLTTKTPEEIYKEAMDDPALSSEELRLLTSGLVALRSAKAKTVNKLEVNALRSLIAYVATEQNAGEAVVSEIMTTHFGTTSLTSLPADRYQTAIEYLLDLKISSVLN